MLANLVWSGWAVVESDSGATRPVRHRRSERRDELGRAQRSARHLSQGETLILTENGSGDSKATVIAMSLCEPLRNGSQWPPTTV
jgi:hypothetical protein